MKRSVSCKPASSFRLIYFSFLFLLICPVCLYSQSDSITSSVSLPEAVIRSPRNLFTGYAVWQADSIPATTVCPLAARLTWESGLNLRQYAPGTLATVSARGSGPSRTAIFWNGLSLQSPMHGVVDASLVPLWPGDRLTLRQGGNSAALGSGDMGGSVTIETLLHAGKRPVTGGAGIIAGSFGFQAIQGDLGFTRGRFASGLRAQWQSAKNDFPYSKKGLDGKEYTVRQTGNFSEKSDVQQFNRISLDKKNTVKTAFWHQQAFRQIPAALTETTAGNSQLDRSTRMIADWEHRGAHELQSNTRSAWQDEFLEYDQSGNVEKSRSQTLNLHHSWQGRAGARTEWLAGAGIQWIRARADGYRNKEQWFSQRRYSIVSQWRQQLWKKGKLSLLMRQEWVDGRMVPFSPTLGWEIPVARLGSVRGHVSRNYNIPTFNDRYWKGLGNETLQPESGYSADLGWMYKKSGLQAELSAFWLTLDNWIIWLPGFDGLFRPDNLRKVTSKGLEGSFKYRFRTARIDWQLQFDVKQSVTENTAIYAGSEGLLHKQLPYVPAWTTATGVRITYHAFSAAYLHQNCGKRYVNPDHSVALPAYQTGVFMLACRLKFGQNHSYGVFLTLDNVWDQTYQSIANRPMPGRSVQAGITASW